MPAVSMVWYIIIVPMKRSLIDTHSHIFDEAFLQDLPEVVSKARESGVGKVLMPNVNLGTVGTMMSVYRTYPDFCRPMIGLHPTDLTYCYSSDLDVMKRLLDRDMASDRDFVAIGEIGLDLYWDQSTLDIQIDAFSRQLEWALEYDLPVSIHSRSAFRELCQVMDSFDGRGLRGVFHCFSSDADEARKLLSYEGFLLGLGGVTTYKKSLVPGALSVVPLDRIVLETDCPYLAPVPNRGKRNEPAFVMDTARKVAEIYSLPVQEVIDCTTDNAVRLFRL